MENAADSLQAVVGNYGPFLLSIVKAIVFIIVGLKIASVIRSYVRKRVLASKNLDKTLGVFFSSIVYYGIIAVVAIAVLQLFGFQATSLVAVLGATTLAIGLALQGTLSHVAAGVMLMFFRPYKLDDYVNIGGESGTVEEVNLFFTQLVTPQNVQIIVANGDAWGSTITNYSHYPTRRLDVTFGIDYGDDINKAVDIIYDVVNRDGRAQSEPEPWVRVVNLNDSSVDLQLRVWCLSENYWEFKFALLKDVKEAFDTGGITIPYPHQVEISKADG